VCSFVDLIILNSNGDVKIVCIYFVLVFPALVPFFFLYSVVLTGVVTFRFGEHGFGELKNGGLMQL
jgi:hypothetical protein